MNRVNLLVSVYLIILNSAYGQSTKAVSTESAGSWPVVIARGGASGYLPEHTTEAAAYAHALKADYIELKCVLSKDNVPVVLRDIALDPVTDVADVFPDRLRDDRRWYVFDFTLEELRRLNVRKQSHHAGSSGFPAGQGRFQIATLREHVELIRGLDHSRRTATGLCIELREPARHRAEQFDVAGSVLKVLNAADSAGEDHLIYLQCFDERELRRLRVDLKCRLPLVQLCRTPPTGQQIRKYARFADGLGISVDGVISGMTKGKNTEPVFTDVIRLSHAHAMQVHVRTAPTDQLKKSAKSVDQLLDWLVQDAVADWIYSDRPDKVLSWRASRSPKIRTGPFQLIRKSRE